MLEAPSAHRQQPHEQPNHGGHTEVPAQPAALEAASDHGAEIDPAQLPLQQFQTSQLHFAEIQSKIPINVRLQIGISSSHCQWPFVEESLGGTFFQLQRKAFFTRARAPQAKHLLDHG